MLLKLLIGHNFLNWHLTLQSFHYSLYERCTGIFSGDVHWARLQASALGSFCCLPRMEGRRKTLSDLRRSVQVLETVSLSAHQTYTIYNVQSQLEWMDVICKQLFLLPHSTKGLLYDAERDLLAIAILLFLVWPH